MITTKSQAGAVLQNMQREIEDLAEFMLRQDKEIVRLETENEELRKLMPFGEEDGDG